MRFGPAILLAALPLGACGPMVDDPGNMPKLGRWERSSKVLALIANDVWIDRKKVPLKLPQDETEIKSASSPSSRRARRSMPT